MITIVLVLVGVAAVGYVLVSRLRGQALNARRMLMLPGVLTVIGLVQVSGLAHKARAADLILLAAGVVLSAVLGVARGTTVAVFIRSGRPWLRYRPVTIGLWVATFAVRVALTTLAYVFGAAVAASGPAILLSIGATLLGESAMVVYRAFSTRDLRWQARTQCHPVASR
jgi:hypothetical protein